MTREFEPRSWSRREVLALAAAAAAAPGLAGRLGASPAAAAATGAPLHERPVPSSGERLPIVGLGTYRVLDVAPQGVAGLEPLLAAFVAAGARVADTSPMYARSEAVLGELATRLAVRDQLFLATKVWTRGRDEGIRQMEESFRLLGTTKIDLLQVHNLLDFEVHLETLAAWKREGRVRYVGVTHYEAGSHAALAAAIRRGGLDFVQVNYSIAEREAERELLPLAASAGVAVLVNRPFVAGRIFARLADRPLPAWLVERGCATWAQAMLQVRARRTRR